MSQTTLKLTPAATGARSGEVSVSKTDDGILIAGYVDGPAPDFPASASEIMRKDHIEIWLSVTPDPQFPPLKLKEDQESQRPFRNQLRRLFVRQWQLAPHVGVESFATEAHKLVAHQDWRHTLDPCDGVPTLVAKTRDAGGYEFETMVPWRLFPPIGTASIEDLHMLVEVFSPAVRGRRNGPYATTAPGRRYAQVSSFNQIHLDSPRQYKINLCGSLPNGLYFFPGESTQVQDVIVFESGIPSPWPGVSLPMDVSSPLITPAHPYSKTIGPEEFICGPLLQHAKAGLVTDLSLELIKEEDFGIHRDADGTILIRNGPRVGYIPGGRGACGGCPLGFLTIYALRPSIKGNRVFDVTKTFDDATHHVDVDEDADIQLSPDWRRVGTSERRRDYLQGPQSWHTQFEYRSGLKYIKCGPMRETPPGKPRTLNFAKEYESGSVDRLPKTRAGCTP